MNHNKKNGIQSGILPVGTNIVSQCISLFVTSGYFLVLLTVVIYMVSCAHTQKKILPEEQKQLYSFFVDSLETVKAYGNIAFSLHGERYRGTITVSLQNWTDFTCEVYTPFAQTIASISSDMDSAEIIIEDREYRIGVFDEVSTIPFFTIYPFIFNDLIRILTGRIIKRDYIISDPSKVVVKGRRTEYIWQSDSLTVSMNSSRGGKKIKRINYNATGGLPWKLEFSSFKNGISKEIYFESEEKNYFSLVFNTIKR